MTASPEDVPTDSPACIHHWLLGSPVGGVTTGHCRDCGTAKNFVESAPRYVLASRRRK